MPTARAAATKALADLLAALAADPAAVNGGVRVVGTAGGLVGVLQVCRAGAGLPTLAGKGRRAKAGDRAACREDILALLGKEGRRLVTKEVEAAMKKLPRPHGKSTVVKALADLVRAKVIDNRRDGRGYGLIEWARPGTPSLFTE